MHNFIKLGILLLVMTPMLAHSYTLTTRINNLAGQLQVASYPVQNTSGAVMRSMPNVNPAVPVVITPAPGYVISNIQQGTTYLTVTPSGQTVTIPANNTVSQTINVWFDKTLVPVTASAGVGGSVSPSGTLNLQQGTTKSYVFTPAAGKNVVSISGYPAGATVTPAVPAATNTPVTVSFTIPATAVTMNVVFQSVIANAGSPQTVLAGSTVTLSGFASTGASNYTWTQTAGTPVTLSSSTAVNPTFTAAVAGSYQFQLVASSSAASSTAYTTVTATGSAAETAQTQCQNCHQPLGIGVSQNVYGNWALSPHSNASPPVMCYACHTGTDTGGHPGPALSSLANICQNCHLGSPETIANHPVDIGSNTCVSCHNPHSTVATGGGSAAQGAPHFNNITGGMYPASYMTSKSDCTNCHVAGSANKTIRQQWKATGHAATTALPWIDYDFKTRSECVRCHTTTGFIAYSTAKVTAAWGVASDKTKEVLTCIGCHSNVAAGTIRAVTPNKPYADEQTFTNHSVGISNICMDCHTGRNNGASIQVKVGTSDFTNLAYIAPHYLSAGGSLQGKSGFHFPGKTYTNYSSNIHRLVGRENAAATGTDGPCVACHMSATNKHSFKPVTTDSAGVITAVTTTVCTNCHNAMLPDTLDASRKGFVNALHALKMQLQDKGFTYSDAYPYFAAKNWGSAQNGANTMGAAFNYKLFLAEPGAYSHSPEYAKQLIIDSIVAVANNGDTNGSITIDSALNDLFGKGLITSDERASINDYKSSDVKIPVSCYSCHPALGGSHAAHIGTLAVTAYGTADPNYTANNSDIAGYKFGCAYCHPDVNPNHTNGTIALSGNGVAGTTKTNITCTASSCHSDGKGAYSTSPNWYTGFTGADKCAMCHAASPATGSHTAHTSINGIHDGSSNITYAATLSCAKCHASTVDGAKTINFANHVNGDINVAFAAASEVSKAQISAASFNKYSTVWTRTGAVDTSKLPLSAGSYANGTCSTIACHNNGTTPAWNTAATPRISCVDCHSAL